MNLEITTHNTRIAEHTEAKIRRRAAKLSRHFDRITACRILVEGPNRNHRQGGQFGVRIDLTVPGRVLTVNQQKGENLPTALREAFAAAQRQLEDYTQQRRHEVKSHDDHPRGRVTRIFRDDGYGFIEAPPDREVYFHRNSVLGSGFDQLEVGSEVRFVEEQGEKGPQASSVYI